MKTKIEKIFQKFCPNAKQAEKFIDALLEYMPRYELNTDARIAMFLAQAIHESGHFTRFSENLNYSAIGLANTWPNRYAAIDPTTKKTIKGKPNTLANQIARDPVKIANNVYANRMGNGDESSGDGWKYRGRGIFQLTGKYNYVDFQNNNPDIRIVDIPDLVANPPEAVITACWFWSKNNLNRFADKGDISGCSKAINGGVIGLEERKKIYNEILELLKTV